MGLQLQFTPLRLNFFPCILECIVHYYIGPGKSRDFQGTELPLDLVIVDGQDRHHDGAFVWTVFPDRIVVGLRKALRSAAGLERRVYSMLRDWLQTKEGGRAVVIWIFRF